MELQAFTIIASARRVPHVLANTYIFSIVFLPKHTSSKRYLNPLMTQIIPPGLEDRGSMLSHYASGGHEKNWLSYTKIKHYTNAFIVTDDQVLLGYKKRGFGRGKYNGFGGKVEPGETSLQAAVRELEEESGVTAPLEHVGSLLFVVEGEKWALQTEIYRTAIYHGTLVESDEMRPEWFLVTPPTCSGTEVNEGQLAEIPFSQMWESDSVWFPLLISKQKFAGRADFTRDGEEFKLHRWWYAVASEL